MNKSKDPFTTIHQDLYPNKNNASRTNEAPLTKIKSKILPQKNHQAKYVCMN